MSHTDPWLDTLLAHDAWIRGLARHLVADEHTADDLAQEAWIEAMQGPPSRADSLRGWLGQVVRNLALMHRRSSQRRRARETEAARPEGTPSAADVLERETTRHELARVVCALEEPYRSAILLRYFEGLPPRKIARRLGVSRAAVETRLKRGLHTLRARLDRDHGCRNSWHAALIPLLAAPAGPGLAASITTTGVVLVSTKVKIGLAALLLALVVGVIVWTRHDSTQPAPPAGSAAPDRTAEIPPTPLPDPPPETETPPAPTDPSRTPDERVARPVPRERAVFGHVRDRAGNPVAGARVCHLTKIGDDLTYSTDRATRTDETGAYELGPFPETARLEVVVEASAPGFATERRSSYMGVSTDFTLASGGSLTGHVRILGTNRPVTDAVLLLYRRKPARIDWHRHTLVWAGTRTDQDGAYRFQALPPDVYRVKIYPPDHPPPPSDTLDVAVGAGAETVQDYRVSATAGLRVRGRVLDAIARTPIQGARVRHWRNPRVVSVTDVNGRYELPGVDPAHLYTGDLDVHASGYIRIRSGMLTELSSAALVLEHDLLLQKAASITGRVVDDTGRGVAGARVSGGSSTAVSTDTEGRFCLPEVTPYGNQNTVRVEADGFERYVSSPFTIQPGEVKRDLLIQLVKGVSGTVQGRVTDEDGAPVAEARVFLESVAHPRRGVGYGCWADDQGRFRFPHVSAGRYDLTACTRNTYQRQATNLPSATKPGVQVAAGARVEVDVTLTRGTFLAGQVVDTRGAPLADVALEAQVRRYYTELRRTVTDARGTFRIEGLPPRTTLHYLIAQKPGYGRKYLSRKIVTGASDVRITLQKQPALRGKVMHTASGQPATSFWVELFCVEGGRTPPGNPRLGRKRYYQDDTGRFTAPAWPGTYRVAAGDLTGARSATQDVVVEAGQDPEPIRLILERGATLKGRVHGSPSSEQLLVQVCLPEKNNRIREEKTGVDQEGRFGWQSLPGGPALVRAVVQGEPLMEAMTAVELTPGTTSRVELMIRPCGRFQLRVVNEAGEPVARARYTVHRRFGPHELPVPLLTARYTVPQYRALGSLSSTNGTGTHHPIPLPPGAYTVVVTARDHAPARAAFQVVEGQLIQVPVTLKTP